MVNNQLPPPGTIPKAHTWAIFVLGFLVAVQLVQFFLIFLLYHYITNIDHKLSDSIRDSKKEVIQMINNRQ